MNNFLIQMYVIFMIYIKNLICTAPSQNTEPFGDVAIHGKRPIAELLRIILYFCVSTKKKMTRTTAVVCVALMLAGRAYGQITLNAGDLPQAGAGALFSRATGLESFNPEVSGPNRTWDFRNLTPTSQLEQNYVAGLATPYAFFFAQNFGVEDANLGFLSQLGAIPIGGFNITLDNPYLFFSKNATRYSAVGRGVTLNGFPAPFFYTDPDEIYHFPMTYQRQDASTFRFNVQIPTFNGGYRSSGTRNSTVDGWGTVSTPTGTYTCLRLKSVVVFNDTLDIPEGLPLPIPLPITQVPLRYTRTEYTWLAPGEGVPIAQVNVVSAFQFQLPLPIIPNFGGFTEILWRDLDRRPVAAFSTIGQLTGCAPLTVKFVNESLRGDVYRWSFGDGRTSVDPNPTYVYTRPGDFSVTLTVTNAFGTDSLRKVRLVRADGVIPNFAAERTAAPLEDSRIKFANQTTGPQNLTYLWDFGDGFLSAERAPTHYYRYPGVYTVGLTARTATGCEGEAVKKDYISIGTTGRHDPAFVSSLTAYPNPSYNDMSVEYAMQAAGKVEFALFDATGRKVWAGESVEAAGKISVPRPENPGLYLLELRQNGSSVRIKAVWL